jgi:PKD repeat protein
MMMKKKNRVANIVLLLTCSIGIYINSMQASTPIMLVRLDVSGHSMQHETVAYFDSVCTFNYNNQYDALSSGSPHLKITTRFDNMDFQVKGLPALNQNMSIPIKVVTDSSGTYQIYAVDIQNLPSGACLILHDNLTNMDQDMRLGSYNCSISDTESIARFVLNISTSLLSVSGNPINPTCSASANGSIIAVGSGTGPWNYYWKDSLNNIIKTTLGKNATDTLTALNKGAYRVDINTNGTCNNGTLYFNLRGSLSPIASYTVPSDTVSINDPQGISFTNKSTYSKSYWWDFGDGTGTSDTNATRHYFAAGKYAAKLTAYGSMCPDTSYYTKEITVTNEATGIKQNGEVSNTMLINKDANGYYVKFNYSTKTNALISVCDLLGQKVNDDIKAIDLTNEKVYISIGDAENRMIIISAVSTSGQKAYRKIIN